MPTVTPPRLFLTGAACAGVTTLGQALSQALGLVHVDVDDHYWLPTDPPYTTKRPPAERVQHIRRALGEHGWVLSGSMDGWGDALAAEATQVVFVYTNPTVRMARLLARERQRHGDRILPGGDMHAQHLAFADWAAQYDQPGPDHAGRSLPRHEAWLHAQPVPVLRVDGATPLPQLVGQVLAHLDSIPGVSREG